MPPSLFSASSGNFSMAHQQGAVRTCSSVQACFRHDLLFGPGSFYGGGGGFPLRGRRRQQVFLSVDATTVLLRRAFSSSSCSSAGLPGSKTSPCERSSCNYRSGRTLPGADGGGATLLAVRKYYLDTDRTTHTKINSCNKTNAWASCGTSIVWGGAK